jgi:hypothetical protein
MPASPKSLADAVRTDAGQMEAIVQRIRRFLIPGVVVAVALILILAQAPGEVGPQSMPGGEPVSLIAAKGNGVSRVPPRVPPGGIAVQTSIINVNYLAPGATLYGKTCKAWPPAAKTAFNYGVGIWATILNSTVPSTIDACWTTLAAGILGSSGALNHFKDFSGAPQANTYYPVALANALHGSDLDPAQSDMGIVYSDAFSWYFGTDGATPVGSYDLVSVVLHEIAHGWGFAGTMYSAQGSTVANWGTNNNWGYPGAYDRFTENGLGQSLLNTALFPNFSAALKGQLTGNNLYFDGPHANAANGGSRPQIYAPSPWVQGSSYAHLAESFNTSNGGRDALMTYALDDGQSIHDPGPVSLGILEDVGWTMSGSPPTPTATRTSTSTPTVTGGTPVAKVYLPLAARTNPPPATPTTTAGPGAIYGRVTTGGAAANGLPLLLRFWNGAAWSTWGTTTTNASGDYAFVGVPTLGAGQRYYVRYENNLSSTTRLSLWQAPQLTSYSAGATAAGGSFDLANITLAAPAPGSSLPLPVTFQWNVRPATPSDSYEFNINDYSVGSGEWWSPHLGYAGQYRLAALPPGLTYPNTFSWYPAVYGPDGGYGESYYFRTVMFTNGVMSATDAPSAAAHPGAVNPRRERRMDQEAEGNPPRLLPCLLPGARWRYFRPGAGAHPRRTKVHGAPTPAHRPTRT